LLNFFQRCVCLLLCAAAAPALPAEKHEKFFDIFTRFGAMYFYYEVPWFIICWFWKKRDEMCLLFLGALR